MKLVHDAEKTKKLLLYKKTVQEEDVIKMYHKLFDISLSDINKKIKQDELRDKEARKSDLSFLRDQHKERLQYIGNSVDINFKSKAIVEAKRHEEKLKKERNEKERSEKERVEIFNLLDSSVSESEMEYIESGTLENAMDEIESGTLENTMDENDNKDTDPDFTGPANDSVNVVLKFNINNMIEKTSKTFQRYNVGIGAQTAIMASILNAGGADLDKLKFSKSTVNSIRSRALAKEGENIIDSMTAKLQGCKLQLHADTKEVLQQDPDGMMRKVERLAVNVTCEAEFPGEDFLLGVIPVDSSKGVDVAEGIFSLLQKYELTDEIYSICTDTTASMSGVRNGLIVLLQNKLKRSVLWTLCRRHSSERHVKKALWQLSGESTFGPTHPLYQKLRKKWPESEVNSKLDKLNTFSWENKPEFMKRFVQLQDLRKVSKKLFKN